MARTAYHPDQLPPSPDAALDALDIPRELRTPTEEARLLSLYQADPALEGQLRAFDALLAEALTCADEDEPSPRSLDALFAKVAADRLVQTAQDGVDATQADAEVSNPFKHAVSGERLPVEGPLELPAHSGQRVLGPPTTGASLQRTLKQLSTSSQRATSGKEVTALADRRIGRSSDPRAESVSRSGRPTSASGRASGWMARATPWLGLLAAALLVVVLVPRSPSSSEGDPMRTRGQELTPLTLELLAVVERLDGSLRDALEGVTLSRQDGLIFRFRVGGGQALTLLERDPRGTPRILYQNVKLDPQATDARVDIVDGQGKPLRYTPDGPAGVYTYWVILGRTSAEVGGDPAALLERALQATQPKDGREDAVVVERLAIRFDPGK